MVPRHQPIAQGRPGEAQKFKSYEIGYFHIDIAELRYEGGKGFLFVAIDRTSKLVFARIYRRATKLPASAFLKVLIKAVPYPIHTILTDNGVQFVHRYLGVSRTYARLFNHRSRKSPIYSTTDEWLMQRLTTNQFV